MWEELTGRILKLDFECLVKVRRAVGIRVGSLSADIQAGRLGSSHLNDACCRIVLVCVLVLFVV